jgi:hypothetical protein
MLGRTPTHAYIAASRGLVDFGVGQPARDLLPAEMIHQAMASRFAPPYATGTDNPSVDKDPGYWLNYGVDCGGRSACDATKRMLSRVDKSRSRSPGDLMMSAGNSHALSMACHALASPGDVILVENPTYYLAHGIFADAGLRCIPVDLYQDDEELELLCNLYKPRLLYTVPTYQNPGRPTTTPSQTFSSSKRGGHTHTLSLRGRDATTLPTPQDRETFSHIRLRGIERRGVSGKITFYDCVGQSTTPVPFCLYSRPAALVCLGPGAAPAVRGVRCSLR